MLRDRSLIPLSHQHHNALALCVLTERSLVEDTSEANVSRLAQRIVDRYEIEMRNHFELEEQVLFPHCPSAAGFIAEHRQMEAMVGQLRIAPAVDLLRAFTTLLRDHVRKEEGELFESAQREIPREKLDEIGAVLDARAVRVCL